MDGIKLGVIILIVSAFIFRHGIKNRSVGIIFGGVFMFVLSVLCIFTGVKQKPDRPDASMKRVEHKEYRHGQCYRNY